MSRIPPNLPWAAPALIAAFGVVWGICEYRENVDIRRVQATLEFHAAFRNELRDVRLTHSSEGDTRRVLEEGIDRIRCLVLDIGGVNCDALEEDEVVKVREASLDSAKRAEVRRQLNRLLAKRITLNDNAVSDYYAIFNSVRVCILASNCDLATALALFAKEMTNYLNQICVYAEEPHSYIGKKETTTLAQFLLDNGVANDILWSDDEGRESLFLCDYLRDLSAMESTKNWVAISDLFW